jgi:D-alanyl-D-alanine carboxypeptidase
MQDRMIRPSLPKAPAPAPAQSIARVRRPEGSSGAVVQRQQQGGAQAAATPFPASVLSPFGTPEQTAFKQQVYSAHVASAQARGRVFHSDLPASQLAEVESGFRMRSDAAASCRDLLAQARADLATAKTAGDATATAATSIGIVSAYRSATDELGIWQSLFPAYYAATATARAAAQGGEHGPAAVQIMVNHYASRKAAPGFGNHTEGIAVDFTTVQGGVTLTASVAQNALWAASWLHQWLATHAANFHFTPLSTEAWHWEFHP